MAAYSSGILSTIVSRLNKASAPFLLRNGLTLRHAVSQGSDQPILDSILLLPISQRLISQEVHHDYQRVISGTTPSAFDTWADNTFDRIFGPDQADDRPPRLQILENYLRPVLVPNERFQDVHRWMFHARFLQWARLEYLRAVHQDALLEALERYPRLRRGPQIKTKSTLVALFGNKHAETKVFGLQTAPSCSALVKAFDMKSWSGRKDSEGIWNRMTSLARQLDGEVISIPGCTLRFAHLDPQADLSQLSLEDILELAGGHVANLGPFNLFCEEFQIFTLWTQEYVDALAKYLMERTDRTKRTLILHISSEGILASLLQEKSDMKKNKCPLSVATIPAQSTIKSMASSILQAGAGFDEVVVLCSWMPGGQDWSASFRQAQVHEYILIGEADDGNFGDCWHTWGNRLFHLEEGTQNTPPYQRDGYRRVDLKDLAKYQFARFDCKESANSSTVSFRRER